MCVQKLTGNASRQRVSTVAYTLERHRGSVFSVISLTYPTASSRRKARLVPFEWLGSTRSTIRRLDLAHAVCDRAALVTTSARGCWSVESVRTSPETAGGPRPWRRNRAGERYDSKRPIGERRSPRGEALLAHSNAVPRPPRMRNRAVPSRRWNQQRRARPRGLGGRRFTDVENEGD